MPRYFFNIADGAWILEREGLSFSDLQPAETYARQLARTCRSSGPRPLSVIVTDEDGSELYRTPVARHMHASSAAFLVLGHGRQQLLWFEVTRHPTEQITEAFPWASAPAYLVRDNDRAYGHVFTSRVSAMGIRDRPISPGSPWQNGHAERLIGTVRRECLDRMLIFGEQHLRRLLASYAAYYNQARTHLALGKDAPLRRAIQRSGVIVAIPILSGLHHQYVRI